MHVATRVALMTLTTLAMLATAEAQARSFDAVEGWRTLRWSMTLGVVREALARMSITPALETMHAMHLLPRAPSDAPDAPAPTVCVSYDRLTWRAGSRDARASLEGLMLREVRFVEAGFATEHEALARRAALARRYGPPHADTRSDAYGVEARALRWSNASTTLELRVAHVGGEWVAHEVWSPALAPAPR